MQIELSPDLIAQIKKIQLMRGAIDKSMGRPDFLKSLLNREQVRLAENIERLAVLGSSYT